MIRNLFNSNFVLFGQSESQQVQQMKKKGIILEVLFVKQKKRNITNDRCEYLINCECKEAPTVAINGGDR